MAMLLEDPAPIWIAGAVGLTAAVIVYLQLRTLASAAAVLLVAVLTVAGLVAEHLYQTDSEQVEAALDDLLAAVQANDLPAVLAKLSPSATKIRSDVETMMPRLEIKKAFVMGATETTFPSPTRAYAKTKVFAQALHPKTGIQGGKAVEVVFQFEKSGDRWLLAEYDAGDEWRRGAAQLEGRP